MKLDPTVQVALVEHGASLLNSLIFVAASLFIIVKYKRAFGDFFRGISELSFKTPAGEFTAKATQAGVFLGAAQSARRDESGSPSDEIQTIDAAAVSRSVTAAAEAAPRLRNRTIIWVDDHPGNNNFEMQALEAVGIRVDTALSTENALAKMAASKYDLAITDLTRGRDGDAGLKFLSAAKAVDRRMPIIVYSSARGAHKYPEALNLGAAAATYRPNELFDQVVRLITG